jgi:hypothetical protein
MEREM